jgi:hypothetical protein
MLLGFYNIYFALALLIVEYLLFNDKKIKIDVVVYLLLGYLLRLIYNGIILSTRN